MSDSSLRGKHHAPQINHLPFTVHKVNTYPILYLQDYPETYGIDWYEGIPDSTTAVVLPETGRFLHLEPEQKAFLAISVDPLSESDHYGMDLYTQTVQIVTSFLQGPRT